MVYFRLSVSLHDVVALGVEAVVGGGGTHICTSLQRGVDPVAARLRGEDEGQVSTYA